MCQESYSFATRYLSRNRLMPVSSIYIWSENLVAESEAKDGGNWRPVPVPFYCFCLHAILYPEPAIFRGRIESSGIIHESGWIWLVVDTERNVAIWQKKPGFLASGYGLSQSSRFFSFVCTVNTNWHPVPVPFYCFSCFDGDLKKNTVVLWTDNLFSDTIRRIR